MNWIESVRNDIADLPQSKKDLKKFGLTVGGVLLLFSILAYWKHWWGITAIAFVECAGLILITFGLFIPAALKLLHRIWMSIALILGSIVSRIILGVIFFLIVTPVAVTARIFGKEFLPGSRRDKKESYWIQRDPKSIINYERMS